MSGPEGTNPADYIYLYQDHYYESLLLADTAVKDETRNANEQVGDSAHLQGNSEKAKAVMNTLGYMDDQFEMAGQDACNF
jgi:hypothetical protein